MTNDELIAYYVNLLIIQYHEKPNAKAHIEALATETVAKQIISQVWNGFEIDTAVGAQLDIIGKYVGVPRLINGFDFNREYLAMPDYSDPSPGTYKGFAAYGDTPTAFFARYGDENNQYQMNDVEMRYILKLKIALNGLNTSLKGMDDIVDDFFMFEGSPVVDVTDNLDMTVNWDFNPATVQTEHLIAVFMGYLPYTAGVELVITGI